MRLRRVRQALNQALADAMREDDSVLLIGEDIGAAGGAFKVTDGLLDEFGERRVRDTPISEMGFLGAAVGAASAGLRPVVEIMFVEFLGVALDQLVTEAANFRFLSRGSVTVPMTVRTSVGGGLGFGCQHSQVLDHWFRATPGLKVVMPSAPQNAYGLLRSAIRDPDPVVVLEHKALYGVRGELSTGSDAIVPIGRADLRTVGGDVTIVGLGQTVHTALEAASGNAWSADVIDLLSLRPWDEDAVLSSVSRTGRLVTVEEAPYTGGWGTQLVAEVARVLHGELRAPPVRITTPDTPSPYAGELEDRFLPSANYVRSQVTELLSTGRAPVAWWNQKEFA